MSRAYKFSKGAVFKMILSDFAALGYKVSYRVLNAADYGVPQTRQRVIIIGVRNVLTLSTSSPHRPIAKMAEMGCHGG